MSIAGTSESSSVLSPSSALPRAWMPATAARSPATTSVAVKVSLPFSEVPIRSSAVPQMGPEVPPIRAEMAIAILVRKTPASVRS